MTAIRTLDDAINIIATAAHLGETVPAIPGTTVHLAVIHQEGGRYTNLPGIYPTREAAEQGISNWILESALDGGAWGPWSDNPEWDGATLDQQDAIIEQWLSHNGHAALNAWYFGDGSDDWYDLFEMKVEKPAVG